ncbi:Sec23-binding domain of Sec16-domain-containing protein [Cerioporus squamosus]|nr:Sec23-binding domain of Sec16-domain-containing protein [Cerioporus squamosus]
MSTAGEAASLFGAPDIASDPFSAALGGDGDPNTNAESSNAVSDLFGSATEAFPVDEAGSSSVAQPDAQQTWYNHAGQQQPYGYTSYAQTNGTYSQYGQYDSYAQSNAYSQPAAPSTSGEFSRAPSYAPQTTYSSYTKPTSTYAPAMTQNGTYSASAYEPGLHAISASAAPTHSSYDAYKPAYTAAAPAQTYSYGTESHAQAHVNPPVSVPPPPAPLASDPAPPPPATSNAYDPPIPPPKVKHTPIPPRPVYHTPPPSLPPPPKGPRKTPDPHSLPPARRDSHSSVTHAPPLAHSGPYAPPVPAPRYNSPPAHGVAPITNGTYGGLPQVNDTYAPSQAAYVPGLPQQTSPAPIFGAPDHQPHTEHTSSGATSPISEAILEVDEEATPQPSFFASTEQGPADPEGAPSSPPTSVGARPVSDPYAPNPSSSPERTLSPPRASSTAPPPLPGQAPASTYNPYAPPPKLDVSDRAKSPGASSIRSIPSAPKQNYEPPRRDSITTSPPLSRPLSSQSRRSTLSSQYDPPPPIPDPKRAVSPTGSSTYDPYAPPAGGPSTAHGRTTSNGSSYSATSLADPYAPGRHSLRTSSEHTYGSFTIPETTTAPVHSTYAPSPSLLGTNDPLGRASARIPVLVTCFHGADMSAGFDVALSARQSTDVHIRSLDKLIPESALDTSATSFPGPLYSDPGSPTASLVRTGAQALKSKKAKVVKYLEDRAEEMAAGLGYHRAGTVDRSRAEAKRILVLLLKVMVENDGRLSGSAEVDSAVRAALLPQEGTVSTADSTGSSGMIPATSTELLSSSYSLSSALPNTQDQTVSKTVVRSSQLDKIQDLLARGDRRGACHYAADEKLWSHALLIASSVDKECWKEVVTEWIRAELVTDTMSAQGEVTNGREPLRVAYSLFGGNGAAAVQELVHPKALLQHVQSQSSLQIPQPATAITPLTPNFQMIQPLDISQEVLASWAKTASMILSNPMTPESSAALTALGDQLAAHQWIEAAHACYLLSPQTSPLGGLGSSSRLILLGSPPPTAAPTFYKDPDPIIFSEIAEFAMSLATPTKGQEPFAGLPHLQPYRLIRAACLAELGNVQLANRYCEAIAGCISRGSPYINVTFVEQLKGLSDRLTAAPQLDKSGSWIGGKMAKPSLDSIGNWLEGRFTKFIAGEGDSPRPEESKSMQTQQSYTGPFANYSSISSATTSAYPSPHQSVTDLTDIPSGAPPFRTGSALGNRPPSRAHAQINRASSAMDHVRPFADAGPYGNGYTPAPAHGFDHLKPDGDVSGQHSKVPSSNSWGWGQSESDVSTPTATSFVQLDDQPSSGTSNSGFISLMDDPMLSATPTGSKQLAPPPARASQNFDDDDDDLGLGNASSKRKTTTSGNGDAAQETPAKEEKPAQPEKPAEVKQTASSGWLSRLWKRSDSTSPAPVKANLGEESAFYYDKELKRWVNKNSAAEAAKPSQPPPPPRAQTASPGRAFGAMPPPSPMGGPPRPATAHPIDLSSEPPRRPPTRVRSNLVPSDAEGSPATPSSPLPPSASGTPPPGNGPPMSRPRGAAGKRNVRSRYVDVFSQENGGAS